MVTQYDALCVIFYKKMEDLKKLTSQNAPADYDTLKSNLESTIATATEALKQAEFGEHRPSLQYGLALCQRTYTELIGE